MSLRPCASKSHRRWHPAALILCCLAAPAAARAQDANVTIHDDSEYHVHPPGEVFTIGVEVDYTGASSLTCRWRDFRGDPLGDPVPLDVSAINPIASPDTAVGYYGLYFEADPADVTFNPDSGLRQEIGFAILPEIPLASRELKPESPFGMVHADIHDPYHHPGYVKTTWTGNWTTPEAWLARMSERRDLGLIEVPLHATDEWFGDNTVPISSAELEALRAELLAYFSADPDVLYWELGLEENLKAGSDDPYYWPNLAAKFEVARQAKDEVNPAIRLIYQIEGFSESWMQAFFESDASDFVDILALHPYRWPDFPSPEEWLEDHLTRTREIMAASGAAMPIWLTEVGAPHHGNPDPDGFFGYPDSGAEVEGTTRRGGAVYLIKIYVLCLASGVEKIFWYNYHDRGPSIFEAEDHFGMVDHWGFPKPAYAAFINLVHHLERATLTEARKPAPDLWVYDFLGPDHDTLVAWVYPEAEQEVSLSSLRPGLTPYLIFDAFDSMGTPLPAPGDTISVDGNPLYLSIAKGDIVLDPEPDPGPDSEEDAAVDAVTDLPVDSDAASDPEQDAGDGGCSCSLAR